MWILLDVITMMLGVALSVMLTHRHQQKNAAGPAVPAREPRDTSRPVLRLIADADPADPRLSVCPVCGMDGDEVTLDGQFWNVWPAHGTCMEWLGGWKPAAGIPYAEAPAPQVRSCCGTPPGTGHRGTCPQSLMNGGTEADVADSFAESATALSHTVTAAFGIPPAQMGPEPELTRWCICGNVVHAHIQMGPCPYHPHPSR